MASAASSFDIAANSMMVGLCGGGILHCSLVVDVGGFAGGFCGSKSSAIPDTTSKNDCEEKKLSTSSSSSPSSSTAFEV